MLIYCSVSNAESVFLDDATQHIDFAIQGVKFRKNGVAKAAATEILRFVYWALRDLLPHKVPRKP